MARRGVHRGFIRPPKKTVMWIDNTAQSAVIAVPAATVVLISQLSAEGLALRPFTVLRSRGIVVVGTDQEAADEEPFGTYGEIVVSESAAAAGVGSIPSPITEAGASWLLYVPHSSWLKFGSGVAFSNVSSVFEYDSKAMRKVGTDDQLVGIVENGNASHGYEFQLNGRTLIQLH